MKPNPSSETNRFQLVKKFPHFMEPEGLLPHSQVPATCCYPEPARSSPSLYCVPTVTSHYKPAVMHTLLWSDGSLHVHVGTA